MIFKRAVYASTLVAGVGLAGVFGVGLGTAAADPGQCNAPNRPPCGPDHRDDNHDNQGHDNNWGPNNNGPAPVDWHNRGVDEGRRDHQPFNWNGQQVYPVQAGNGQGWGFWFGPIWIPL